MEWSTRAPPLTCVVFAVEMANRVANPSFNGKTQNFGQRAIKRADTIVCLYSFFPNIYNCFTRFTLK